MLILQCEQRAGEPAVGARLLRRLPDAGQRLRNVQELRGHLRVLLLGEDVQVHLLQQDHDPAGQHALQVDISPLLN